MLNFNLESFCGELWSQIEINALGDYKICCLANYSPDHGMSRDADGKVMNVLTHSIQEALNSETHKKHRLDLAKNIKVQRCKNCYDSEDSTKNQNWSDAHKVKWGISKRQRVNNAMVEEIPEYVSCANASEFTQDDGTVTSKVVNLALRLGNACNQKCIMCSPEYSNLWYDDWFGLYGQQETTDARSADYKNNFKIIKNATGRNILDYPAWWETDIWWERFDSIAPDLRYLYITGGEPLVTPVVQDILVRLIDAGFAKDIILRFDTNLSVINNKVLEKFKHFKRVDLCLSVEDTDERYNLIRFPGDYQTVIKNIETVKTNGMNISYISSCIGIASIYSMIRITELAEKMSIRAQFRYLEGPLWLDLRWLPPSAKQEIIDVYKSLDHGTVRNNWYRSIIKFLEKHMQASNEGHVKTFVKMMDKLDTLRSTNWKQTLPDVYSLLSRHAPDAFNI